MGVSFHIFVQQGSYLSKQVLASLALHGAPEVLIFVHENCGAYGDLSLSEGQSESDFLGEQLMRAAKQLTDYLRQAGHEPRVRMFICGFDGISEVTSD